MAFPPFCCSTVVDRLGGAHRRTRGEVLMPARCARMIFAPVLVGESEIEIGEGATDRDVPDAERRRRERVGFAVERPQHGLLLRGVGRDVDVGWLRALALAAQPPPDGAETG